MANVSPASSFGAISGARGRRLKAKRLSRAMVDALEPRRLLAPWITGEVAGGTGAWKTTDVEVVGNRAYVAAGAFLEILDVSGTGIPIQLGRVAVPADPASEGAVTVSGPYAYTWDMAGGADVSELDVIDISNPAAPTIVGRYYQDGGIRDVYIAGSYAYLVAGPGLEIVDISNPTAPTPKGSLAISDLVGEAGVTVAGSYAYVSGYELTVVDIADPANPVKVGSCDPRGAGGEVAVFGTTVYAAATGVDAGLNTIDVSNPAAPVVLCWYRSNYPVLDLKVLDSKVYLVEGVGGMDIINVSDPANPSTLSQLDTWGTAHGIAVWGSMVYVADTVKGLQVVNAADPSRPIRGSIYDPPGDPGPIVVSGTVAYTGDNDSIGGGEGLHIFDIANFDAPTWVGMRVTNSSVNDLAISGSYLYATGGTGLEIFNITTPSNPIWVCLYDVRDPAYREQARGIAISGSHAYIACDPVVGGGMASLNVVDIADPAAPVLVGSYAISGGALDVAVSGTLAYVSAGTFGLRIIDVSDPAHMVQVGSLATSSRQGPILLAGSRAYLSGSIIDVSNPAAPVLIGGVSGGVLAVSGDLAFSDQEILNVSDPTAITSVGRYTGNKTDSVVLYGGLSALFGRAGLETIRFVAGENEPATDISLSQSSVAENLPIGTVVGTLSSTCLNPANTFTYSMAGGTGGGSFTISGDQLKTRAVFNYEAKSSYSIRIRSTDAVGQWFDKAFTITVTDVNERPTNISLSASSVVENQPVGTVVGMFSSTDPDAGNTFTYSLVSGTGDMDNGSFTISGNELLTAASFDYHTKSSYSIRVRTTDQGGLWYEKSFTITVTADTTAPAVMAVYVRGSTWNANYLSFLAANTAGSSTAYGYAIPAGSGSTQLETLPWRNLNRISIAFSEDVTVAQAQFAIAGSVGSYSVSGFAYSSIDHVATWSLAAAIGPDKLYVAVPGSGTSPITDAAGNVLDGEWVNPSSYSDATSTSVFPSGNGSVGGDFAFRFDVLPGDCTGGSLGKVNVADALQTKGRSGLPVTVSTYRSDVDGNGAVNVGDVLYVKSKSSVYSLPVNPPVFWAVVSQVSLLQKDRLLRLW